MLCFPLRLFNVPALAVGLVLYYTLSLESINLIPNPNPPMFRVVEVIRSFSSFALPLALLRIPLLHF